MTGRILKRISGRSIPRRAPTRTRRPRTPRARRTNRPAPTGTTQTSFAEASGPRLVARRPLDCAERIGEPYGGAAGPQRLRLALVGCPGRHRQDLEPGSDPAIGGAGESAVDLGHAQERAAPREAAATLAERIRLAHGPELRH